VFEGVAARNTSCVIANSSDGLNMFKNLYLIDPQKLNILPQYISLNFESIDKARLKSNLRIPQNSIIIGMVAHYRPEKYHDLLLNVFEKLTGKFSDIYLIFLGNRNNSVVTNDKFKFLENKILDFNLNSRVFLLSGFKVQEILGILDIGVLVSRIEGMPNAVMEYMLYGLPVVATNHNGCIHLLKESPFLIQNTEKELMEALEKLIESE